MNGLHDIKSALRTLRARPGFALTAVLTLALGIGASTAIFSVVHGLLLAPLPYAYGERLVYICNVYPNAGMDHANLSIPEYLERKEQAPSLEDLAIYTGVSFNLADGGVAPERVIGLRASPSLFATLGMRPMLGRVFGEDDAVPGKDKVVVLGNTLWRNRFNADPGIVGREVRLSGENWRVLGVMPEGFGFPRRNTQLWVPFVITPEQRADGERANAGSRAIGRLRESASIDSVNAELALIVTHNADRLVDAGDAHGIGYVQARAGSWRELQVGANRPMLLILQAAVVLVLLIAAANVANLLLVRLVERRKELALRRALGASRGRLARQVLIEALSLALCGGLVGVVLAMVLMRVLPQVGFDQALSEFPPSINPSVLAFALGMTLIAAMLAALFPLLSLRSDDLNGPLNDSGRLGGGGRSAAVARNALVIAQMTLATALLIGAVLFLRSFVKLHDQSPGFVADGVLTAYLNLAEQRYPDQAARARFYDEVLREARAIPGVERVGWTNVLPFGGTNSQGAYQIDGLAPTDAASAPWGLQRTIDEDYFEVMGIPLIAGRAFSASDSAGREPVVIVDERLADKYFAGKSAIGQRIRLGEVVDTPWARIVGVVGTIRHGSLRERIDKETLYWPFRQRITSSVEGALVLRGRAVDSLSIIESLRTALRRVDPEQTLHDFMMLDDYIALTLQGQRAPMNLIGGFAVLALILAMTGIHAVLVFSISQRTGEIGVRMALGTTRRRIFAFVLGQGAVLTVIGLVFGLALALLLGQWARSQLFGVDPLDALSFTLIP
ncbi:MAG: ABC transporter permease, partial [Dokdonella sp.]